MKINELKCTLKDIINDYIVSHEEEYKNGELNDLLDTKLKNIVNIYPSKITKIGESQTLEQHLRGLFEVLKWKQNIIFNSDNICYISNEESQELEIHHLIPFARIVKDTLTELRLKRKKFINEFSEQEINNISFLFLEKHRNTIGILIKKSLHIQFHKIYGSYTYNETDFNNFVKYINKEIQLDIPKIQIERRKMLYECDYYRENSGLAHNRIVDFVDKVIKNKEVRNILINNGNYDLEKGLKKSYIKEYLNIKTNTFKKALSKPLMIQYILDNKIDLLSNNRYLKF